MMERIRKELILVVVLVLLSGCAAKAPTSTRPEAPKPAPSEVPIAHGSGMPTARAVIDDYIEAIGGREAVVSQESAEATGTFAVPAAGLTGNVTIYAHAPNLALLKVELAGIGETFEGFDGTVAWSLDPMQGPMVKDGKAAGQTEFRSDFYASLHTDERYQSMEVVEQLPFEGRDCFKIRLVTSQGDEVVEYYDVENKLLIGSEMSAETPMGTISVTVVLDDYKAFSGLRMPTKITQKMIGMQQVITIADVRMNVVDKSVFELPEAIKALLEEAPSP